MTQTTRRSYIFKHLNENQYYGTIVIQKKLTHFIIINTENSFLFSFFKY